MRLQELSLRIQRFQESHLSESQYTRDAQTEAIERLFAQIHSLEESQGRTYRALNALRSGSATTRQLTHQSLETRNVVSSSIQRDVLLSGKNSVPQKQVSAMIGLKVQQRAIAECRQNCLCQCHRRNQWRSHTIFNQIFGNLFIRYSRAPSIVLKCDLASYGRHQQSLTTAIYVFPQWLLQQVLSITLSYSRRDGIVASLRTFRPRRNSDMLLVYVSTGEVDRVKALFDRGEASPFDIGESTHLGLLQVRAMLLYVDHITNVLVVCRQCAATRDVQLFIAFESRPTYEYWEYTVRFWST